MTCPYCGSTTHVLDSRSLDHGKAVRRRRQCDSCNQRVTTYETIPKPDGTSARIEGLDIAISALQGVREEVRRRDQAASGVDRVSVIVPLQDA